MKREIDISSENVELELIDDGAEIIPIRTETVLSQYPLHVLNKGDVPTPIYITKEGEKGKTATTWKVSPNTEYGRPGILAYKLDTLVINRIIDQLRPDVPLLVKLGSLSDIGKQLGRKGTRNTKAIADALSQNAGAMIICKIDYTGRDGKNRTLELRSTRYGVIFVGETLPNGRKADAVYISLNPVFHDVLKHAITRPLDYEYLRELPPSAQRLYELISYQIFGALKLGNPRAKYLYSDLCRFAPLTRYENYEQVKKQLHKIHKPHLVANYIKAVEVEETTDEEGRIDWIIWYTPGRKAKAEFKRFNSKEPKALGKPSQPLLLQMAEESKDAIQQESKFTNKQAILLASLLAHKVREDEARLLVEQDPVGVSEQLEALPYRKGIEDVPAFLTMAIKGHYSLPKKLEAQRKKQIAEAKAKAVKAEIEQLETAYLAYLKKELQVLPKKNAEAYAAFLEDFEGFWKIAGNSLSENTKDLMRVHHFSRFVEESTGLKTLSFEKWKKTKQASNKA